MITINDGAHSTLNEKNEPKRTKLIETVFGSIWSSRIRFFFLSNSKLKPEWWHNVGVVCFFWVDNKTECDCNYFQLCCNLFICMKCIIVKLSEFFPVAAAKINSDSLVWWFFLVYCVPNFNKQLSWQNVVRS